MQIMQILFTVQRFNYSTQNEFQRVEREEEVKGKLGRSIIAIESNVQIEMEI